MSDVRVIHLIHQLTRTGAPILAHRTLKLLDSADVWTIARVGGEMSDKFREMGRVTVLAPSPEDREMRPRGRLKATWARARVAAWRPDVTYITSTYAIGMAIGLRLTRGRVLVHVDETAVALSRLPSAHVDLLRSDSVVCLAVSMSSAEALAALGVHEDRIVQLPPVVDIESLGEERGGPTSTSYSARRFVVGGAGSLTWTKGPGLWLLTARYLVDLVGQDSIEFIWVGATPGIELVEFEAMIAKLDLTNNVRIVPARWERRLEFSQFDVLACTSWEDAANLVVLECMLLGVPVVCFDGSGGPPEQVGRAGVVVPHFSPVEMAMAIARLKSDDAERANLSRAGRHVVKTRNAPEVLRSRVRNLFAPPGR